MSEMQHWPLVAMAKAAGAYPLAQMPGSPLTLAAGAAAAGPVVTDSRLSAVGALFVALRGDRFDGHDFVHEVMAGGAAAVMVAADSPLASLDDSGAASRAAANCPVWVVPDTLRALGDMAAWARRERGGPVVAVTGSNGKTTSKEMIAAVLAEGGLVHKTHGNLNNLIGCPKTILSWPADAWAAVVEMGMNSPGEIARMTEMAQPDVGVVTNVGAAHLGGPGLGSLAAIAEAKCELYAGLAPDAVAVVNDDDPTLHGPVAVALAGQRVIRFGTGERCDVRLVSVEHQGSEGVLVRLRIDGVQHLDALVPLAGRHNAMNAAAAAAVGWALGIPVAAIGHGLTRVAVPGGRMRLVPGLRDDVHLVDDTYNANPASMGAAFGALAELAAESADSVQPLETGGPPRRIAVLGDMLELGPDSPRLHREVGHAAATSGVAWVLALGERAVDTAAGAAEGGARAHAYDDLDGLWQALADGLQPHDWVLVKGSRSMRMERVVERVVSSFGAKAEGVGEALSDARTVG